MILPEFHLHDIHLILDYDEYWFEIEEYRRGSDRMYFAHLWFEKFTPSTLKRFLREWEVFRKCVHVPLYAVRDDGDEKKWEHFVSVFGLKPTGINVPCNNGEIRQLFISTVSHEHDQTDADEQHDFKHCSLVCSSSDSAQPSVRGGQQRLQHSEDRSSP